MKATMLITCPRCEYWYAFSGEGWRPYPVCPACGYRVRLPEQRAPDAPDRIVMTDQQPTLWREYRARVRAQVQRGLPLDEAIERVRTSMDWAIWVDEQLSEQRAPGVTHDRPSRWRPILHDAGL